MATVTAYSKAQTDALLSAKASLASPALSGTPTSVTPSVADNSTKIATTAFVTPAVRIAASRMTAVTTQTAAYTAAATDTGATVLMNLSAAGIFTVPANLFVVGDVLKLVQYGAGVVTVTPATSVTFRYTNGLRTNGQYASIALTLIAANEWLVEGNTQV